MVMNREVQVHFWEEAKNVKALSRLQLFLLETSSSVTPSTIVIVVDLRTCK
jgi:hypothetical protein